MSISMSPWRSPWITVLPPPPHFQPAPSATLSTRTRRCLLNMMTWRNAAIRQSSAAAPPPPAPNLVDDMIMQRAVVFTAVLMAILGGTLCVVGLERLIRGRFTLFSMVRFLLRFTFVLFLPLLSYMRARAKDNEVLYVLLWMLLIELFRKKVEAMVPSASGGSFSRSASRFRLMGHSDEVTRLVWIGFLIYTNVDWQSKKAMAPMFAILWSLAVAKLAQRVINEWKAQDSLSAAGSANIIAGYMQHLLEQQQGEEEEGRRHSDGGSDGGSGAAAGASPDPDLDAVMGECQYVVMGEEKLVLNKKERLRQQSSKVLITTPHCGHGVGRFPHDQDELKHVHLLVDLDKVKNLVTVKDIWQNLGRWLARFGNRRTKFIDHMCLMCLSFSLFKLLRRRFEHYPMVEVGSKMARRLMVEGVLNDHGPATADNASRAFRVIQMELDFLDNYYQAGVPVVMSAPWLFLINFLSSLLFVSIYILAVAILVVITANNDDNNSQAKLAKYFIITMLLVITLLAVEMTDFLTTYLFSNWFLVHLLCLYVSPGGCLWNYLVKPIICCFIAYRLLVFNSLKFVLKLTGRPVNEKKMKIRQVSILQVCEPVHKMFSWASQATLEAEAKVAIVEGLKKGIKNPDTGGDVSLPHDIGGFSIRGKTTTEIILACHLATELLEVKHGKPKKKKKRKRKQKQQKAEEDSDPQAMATALSRYCMYLVARVPELLPDDERWVSDRYGDVKRCLKEASRRCCCSTWCCPWRRTRRWNAVAEMKVQLKEATAQAGLELYQQLEKEAGGWKALAEFWVKLLIYLAPSNDVEGHAKALASSGSDLLTCLWALCTHAGIKRHPPEPAPAELPAAGTHQV